MARRKRCFRFVLFIGSVVFSAAGLRADVLFVRSEAVGTNDGSSWDDAFTELQSALAVAQAGDEIHVAAGVYRPDFDIVTGQHTGDRLATFALVNGVIMLGGFPPEGGAVDQRDFEMHESILTGDLNDDDEIEDIGDDSENSYHVVTGDGTSRSTILDGFVIRDGNADGDFPDDSGAGMTNFQANVTVRNCVFTDNNAGRDGAPGFGGGMANDSSDVTIDNCIFDDNSADAGGGVGNLFSQPSIINCLFDFNFGRAVGGGIYNDTSRPVVTNCTFEDNFATDGGGMASLFNSRPVVSKSTFDGNVAFDDGGGIYNEESTLTLIESQCNNNLSNFGAGILNINADATILECTLDDNLAGNRGGALLNVGGTLTLEACHIGSNISIFDGGGITNISDTGAEITNSTFRGNLSLFLGGGLANFSGFPAVTNCTFHGNEAGGGGGIFNNDNSSPAITNCIFWENEDFDSMDEEAQILGGDPDVSSTCIQGLDLFAGNGNIGDDPLFADGFGQDEISGTEDDDVRLRAGSPCIDAGDSFAVIGIRFDAGGNSRVVDDPFAADVGVGIDGVADMGAFEYQPDCNGNGVADNLDIAADRNRFDCNRNGLPDECDLADGTSVDEDGNGQVDDCRLEGDFDRDGDVDLADYMVFQLCFSGSMREPLFDECTFFDFDEDGDVDLADHVEFQTLMTRSQ